MACPPREPLVGRGGRRRSADAPLNPVTQHRARCSAAPGFQHPPWPPLSPTACMVVLATQCLSSSVALGGTGGGEESGMRRKATAPHCSGKARPRGAAVAEGVEGRRGCWPWATHVVATPRRVSRTAATVVRSFPCVRFSIGWPSAGGSPPKETWDGCNHRPWFGGGLCRTFSWKTPRGCEFFCACSLYAVGHALATKERMIGRGC